MSQVCAICEKKYNIAFRRVKTRSHYNPTTKRRQYPNLQWMKLPNGKRIKACTKCIKKLAKYA